MMRNYFEHELGNSLEITPAVYKAARDLAAAPQVGASSWFLVASLDYTVTRRLALRVRTLSSSSP